MTIALLISIGMFSEVIGRHAYNVDPYQFQTHKKVDIPQMFSENGFQSVLEILSSDLSRRSLLRDNRLLRRCALN